MAQKSMSPAPQSIETPSPIAPEPAAEFLIYQKTIDDTGDIVKYYRELEKPPISFHENGLSFVREGDKMELKLVNKPREMIREETGPPEIPHRGSTPPPICNGNARRTRFASVRTF
ncbi:DUF1330 domain-containing protein [Caenorhabditis elegans]|nr:DUF1330 domain-containing protein [Caenorhabditis elegans]CCG28193.1 DUF1330 domain-containing protein [Caenorhabditis elegans]|eukprot:NP_499303.2 Uncharacterized protein CELE_H04D03.2 [Caenorhabditis elegans]